MACEWDIVEHHQQKIRKSMREEPKRSEQMRLVLGNVPLQLVGLAMEVIQEFSKWYVREGSEVKTLNGMEVWECRKQRCGPCRVYCWTAWSWDCANALFNICGEWWLYRALYPSQNPKLETTMSVETKKEVWRDALLSYGRRSESVRQLRKKSVLQGRLKPLRSEACNTR